MKYFSFIFFFLCLHFLLAEEIKCKKCGLINSKDDRYCLECFDELRAVTKKEQAEQNNSIKQKVISNIKAAESYFEKANLTNDIKNSIVLYEIALRNSVNAISFGNKILTLPEIEKLNTIKLICEKKLINLRQKSKLKEQRVPLTKEGNAFYVKVLLNNEVTANLHLDTGCDNLLISPEVADKLNITGGKRQFSIVADGRTIEGKGIVINSVNVGGNVIEKISATVHKTNGDGLLGMEYLKHFNFEIDSKNNELILKPSK